MGVLEAALQTHNRTNQVSEPDFASLALKIGMPLDDWRYGRFLKQIETEFTALHTSDITTKTQAAVAWLFGRWDWNHAGLLTPADYVHLDEVVARCLRPPANNPLDWRVDWEELIANGKAKQQPLKVPADPTHVANPLDMKYFCTFTVPENCFEWL